MKLKKFDSINVIPFIDIMLVLLVIVLTTATFIAKGYIPLDLPKASFSTPSVKKRQEISITKDGKIYLNSKKVALKDLEKLFQNITKNDDVVIRSDKRSSFGVFVKVIDALKKRGVEAISIETKQ